MTQGLLAAAVVAEDGFKATNAGESFKLFFSSMQSPNQNPAPASVARSPTLAPLDWAGDAAASLLGAFPKFGLKCHHWHWRADFLLTSVLGDHETRPMNSALLKDKLQVVRAPFFLHALD
jgi:hypothetical protein